MIYQTLNAKIFANDTSLFSVVHDINTSAIELNSDQKKIGDQAFQWKMTFNPDCSKQAQEIIITAIIELNNLDPSLRNSKSISVFKSELLCWMT